MNETISVLLEMLVWLCTEAASYQYDQHHVSFKANFQALPFNLGKLTNKHEVSCRYYVIREITEKLYV